MDSTTVEDDDMAAVRLDDLAGRLSSALIRLPGRDIRSRFEETLREIVDILDADRSTLVEFSPDKWTIDAAHSWARSGIPPFELSVDLHRLRWLLERSGPGEGVGIAGPGDLPLEAAGDRVGDDRAQLVSALMMPIHVADRRACALSVDSFRRHRDWPASTLAALRFIGEILAAAVHRRRQELELDFLSAESARRNRETENEHAYLREVIQNNHGFNEIRGDCPALTAALNRVRQVAPTDASVLLLGETGTGKELFARALHDASARRQRTLVRVNCAALPATLIESELFGHERGAFTGAVTERQGRFELAHQGTIFLDEIGDLPLELQPKLLRVLQEGEFERIGSSRTRHVDVRVIAATHCDLEAAVEEDRFRADLYYRISVFPIALPPLRERKSDIAQLVWFFIHRHGRRLGRNIDEVPDSTMHALQSYDWPGNVRELENLIERAVIRSPGNMLVLDPSLDGVCDSTPHTGTPTDEATALAEVERRHVWEILRTCNWRINGPENAADRLGLHPNTLRFRMKKLGIVRPSRAGP